MAELEDQRVEFTDGAADEVQNAERAEQLLASANEAAGLVQKVYFTYLLVSLYLAILIGSTTHEQILRESGVPLPIFGVGLSIFWIYALAPWLYVALHVNLLVQHYLLSRKLHRFLRAIPEDVLADADHRQKRRDEWLVRLYPSLFAQMLARADRETFKRFVLRTTISMTIVVAPVILLLWMQIRFLPYHSEPVTWGTRLALFVDLALLWYYWPLMNDEDGSWRLFPRRSYLSSRGGPGPRDQRHLVQPVLSIVATVGVLAVSAFVAVVPGGVVERWNPFTETTPDAWWNDVAGGDASCVAAREVGGSGLPENGAAVAASMENVSAEEDRSPDIEAPAKAKSTTFAWLRESLPILIFARFSDSLPRCVRVFHFRSCLQRHLDVREAKLLERDAPPEVLAALVQDENKKKERERMAGLALERRDLRGAILRGANLTKADLEGADLRGADLGCTTLTGSNLSGAMLHGAQARGANLHDARLSGTWLHDTVLSMANLRAARLTNAELHRADLSKADFRGAELTEAELHDATFSSADFIAAALMRAQLPGVDLAEQSLAGADLGGANLERAVLKGANLIGANLRSARLKFADLTNAKLLGADLRNADLKGAKLGGAEVGGAVFQGAKLHFADLRGVKDQKEEWQEDIDTIIEDLQAVVALIEDLKAAAYESERINRSLRRLLSMKNNLPELSLTQAEGNFYADKDLCDRIIELQSGKSRPDKIASDHQVQRLLSVTEGSNVAFAMTGSAGEASKPAPVVDKPAPASSKTAPETSKRTPEMTESASKTTSELTCIFDAPRTRVEFVEPETPQGEQTAKSVQKPAEDEVK